jgi:hypothetical protein
VSEPIIFLESDQELYELLRRTVERRDEAAARGFAVEAGTLAGVACAIEDELTLRAAAARERQRAECDELARMFSDHPKPTYRGETGWR